ncbi:MAG: hypothetical protein ACYC7E_12965 [Armatimonadota bacterium]
MKCYSFWAINAPLDDDRLRFQLQQLRDAGLDGVVFQPRFYSPPPDYLSDDWFTAIERLLAACPEMDFYVQDENGWPSPAVDGPITREFAYLRQQWIAAYPSEQIPTAADVVAADERAVYVREVGHYGDTLNPELAERFIAGTYEPYQRLTRAGFTSFKGLFCDEPQFGPLDEGAGTVVTAPYGAVPWTADLPAQYAARYGDDLRADLPALFHDLPRSARARVQFYELVHDLWRERFVAPLVAWSREHGMRWTGHFKGEEHPYFQLWFCSPLAQLFRTMGLVGIDSLERQIGERYFLRQSASVIRQNGFPGLVECCGGGGWGMAPADVWAYLCGLGMHGLDELVLHQAQYRLTPLAIHDWPPSTPFHEPYNGCLPSLFKRLKETFAGLPVGQAVHRVLVVAPYRGLLARLRPAERPEMDIHKASYYADSPAGRMNTQFLALLHRLDAALIGYDVISERDFEEHATMEDGLRVGQCTYRALMLAHGVMLGKGGKSLVSAGASDGLLVLDEATVDCEQLAEYLALPIHAAASPMPASLLAEIYTDGMDCRLVLINNDSGHTATPIFTVPGGRYLEGAEMADDGQQLTLLPGEVRVARLLARPDSRPAIVECPWDYSVDVLEPNVLLLDNLQLEDITAQLLIACHDQISGTYLVSLVPLEKIVLNGEEVPAVARGSFRYSEMLSYPLPVLHPGDNSLQVALTAPWQDPAPLRFWLTGDFYDQSTTPWESGPRRTLRANGPFRLSSPATDRLDGTSLTESGFPFFTGKITYTGQVKAEQHGHAIALRLEDVSAAAAHVVWDGEDLGWIWGPRWEVPLARHISAGAHTLTVELFTTAFNLFGPHHHVLGDPPLVTTSHYTGQRDFAQPPEEPVLIVPATHVQQTGLGRTVRILWEASDVD